jgi:hypothetical protein
MALALLTTIAAAASAHSARSGIAVEILYKGEAKGECAGCNEDSGGEHAGTQYDNRIGRAKYYYEWTIAERLPVTVEPEHVWSFGHPEWRTIQGSGAQKLVQGWNCVNFRATVFGETEEPPQCSQPQYAETLDDETPALFVPWLKSADGGLPEVYARGHSQRAVKVRLVSPLNASAVKDTGTWKNTPGVANSPYDWLFPGWNTTHDDYPCMWDWGKLTHEWEEKDRPVVVWGEGRDGFGKPVTRDFDMSIDQPFPAGLCASGNFAWLGDAPYVYLDLSSEVQLKVTRRG